MIKELLMTKKIVHRGRIRYLHKKKEKKNLLGPMKLSHVTRHANLSVYPPKKQLVFFFFFGE